MKKSAPSKAEIASMEPFVGLTLERIHVPTSREEFAAAAAEIKAAGVVGFDTESKPTFAVGEVSEGPHLVQFALPDKAYLFQLHHAAGHSFLVELLRSERLIKAGFGLKSDGGHIQRKLGVKPGGLVDLNTVFHKAGYQREMGVRTAVALVFGRRFAKSRSATTSNWAQPRLTSQQLLYAANDAWAALKVFRALGLSGADSPTKPLPAGASNNQAVRANWYAKLCGWAKNSFRMRRPK